MMRVVGEIGSPEAGKETRMDRSSELEIQRLRAAVGHTQECLEYAASTGRAMCIASCADRRRALQAGESTPELAEDGDLEALRLQVLDGIMEVDGYRTGWAADGSLRVTHRPSRLELWVSREMLTSIQDPREIGRIIRIEAVKATALQSLGQTKGV
jgi:hypothetical protein